MPYGRIRPEPGNFTARRARRGQVRTVRGFSQEATRLGVRTAEQGGKIPPLWRKKFSKRVYLAAKLATDRRANIGSKQQNLCGFPIFTRAAKSFLMHVCSESMPSRAGEIPFLHRAEQVERGAVDHLQFELFMWTSAMGWV